MLLIVRFSYDLLVRDMAACLIKIILCCQLLIWSLWCYSTDLTISLVIGASAVITVKAELLTDIFVADTSCVFFNQI